MQWTIFSSTYFSSHAKISIMIFSPKTFQSDPFSFRSKRESPSATLNHRKLHFTLLYRFIHFSPIIPCALIGWWYKVIWEELSKRDFQPLTPDVWQHFAGQRHCGTSTPNLWKHFWYSLFLCVKRWVCSEESSRRRQRAAEHRVSPCKEAGRCSQCLKLCAWTVHDLVDLKLCGNTTFNLEGVKAKGDLYINLVNLGSFTAAEEKFFVLFFLSTAKNISSCQT